MRACVRACACMRVRVPVCVVVVVVGYIPLSLSLFTPVSKGKIDVTKKVTRNPPGLPRLRSHLNTCHSNVTGDFAEDLGEGTHRWRLHRKVGLGPGVRGRSGRARNPLPPSSPSNPAPPRPRPARWRRRRGFSRVETADRGDRLASGPGAEDRGAAPDDMPPKHVIGAGSPHRFRRFGRDRFRI